MREQTQAVYDEDYSPEAAKKAQALMAKVLKGVGRGTAAFPFDMADVAGMALGQQPGAGKFVRERFLGGEGDGMEQAAELFSPTPPIAKGAKVAGMGAGILVDALRGARAGLIPEQAVKDAHRLFQRGAKPDDIYAGTGVDIYNPSVLTDKPQSQIVVPTPGYKAPGRPNPSVFAENQTLAGLLASGQVAGLDDYLKAIPEAASSNVRRANTPKGNTVRGSYDPATREIELNYNELGPYDIDNPAARRHVLGHELTHTAQDAAGLAPGLNVAAGETISNGFRDVLEKSAGQMENAHLIRALMEQRGMTKGPSTGAPFHPNDVMRLIKSNRGMFANTPKLDAGAMKWALGDASSEELLNRMTLISRLQQKLPPNPFDTYLKAAGEAGARQSETYLGEPMDVIRSQSPWQRDFRHKITREQAFDPRDFDADLLRKLGLIH